MAADGRRSVRNHKAVNYAKLDAGIDDDDDFRPADVSSKKQRKVKETAKMPAVSKEAIKIPAARPLECKATDVSPEAPAQSVQKRPSLDEKLFERDLKVALRLSQQESCVIPILENKEEEKGPCIDYRIVPGADERCRSFEVSSGGAGCNPSEDPSQPVEELTKVKERRKAEMELPRPDAKNDIRCQSPYISRENTTPDDSACRGEPKKKFPKVEREPSLPAKVPCQKPVAPSLKVNHLKTMHSASKVPSGGSARPIRLGLSRRLSAGKPLHSIVRVESH